PDLPFFLVGFFPAVVIFRRIRVGGPFRIDRRRQRIRPLFFPQLEALRLRFLPQRRRERQRRRQHQTQADGQKRPLVPGLSQEPSVPPRLLLLHLHPSSWVLISVCIPSLLYSP